MNPLQAYLQAHPWAVVLGAWYVFSTLVSTMPKPPDGASVWYKWLYAAMHALAGNLPHAIATLKAPKP